MLQVLEQLYFTNSIHKHVIKRARPPSVGNFTHLDDHGFAEGALADPSARVTRQMRQIEVFPCRFAAGFVSGIRLNWTVHVWVERT